VPVDVAPDLTVVVPVLNGERTIEKCLASILRADYPAGRRQVLVVDNGSTDRTADMVRAFPVRCVPEHRRGLASARNRGIAAATTELVAFTDADCVVTTGWLRELLRGFDGPSVGVVVGEVVAYPPRTFTERYWATRKPLWQTRALSYPKCPWFLSGNAAFRREVFDRVGLYDTRFDGGACEDIDLSWRLFDDGRYTLRHQPRALVFHQHRLDAHALYRQYRGYGRGQAVLMAKYPDRLPWGWRRELAAYGDLGVTVLRLGGAAARAAFPGREPTALPFAYLDLVRKIGVRVGFVPARLGRGLPRPVASADGAGRSSRHSGWRAPDGGAPAPRRPEARDPQ
jgi:glycosyltransferase involved in cell wall biosynthesis